MICATCNTTIQPGQSEQFGFHLRAVDCVEATRQATATECLAIAREVGDRQQLGAYRTFRQIRQRFGLAEEWPGAIG